MGGMSGSTATPLPMSENNPSMRYPLSRDEQTAMARYVAAIRTQLQEVTELFSSRYGKNSSLANLSGKALVCATLLEHELHSDPFEEYSSDHDEEARDESAILKTVYHGE
jgi:hypothetical protein